MSEPLADPVKFGELLGKTDARLRHATRQVETAHSQTLSAEDLGLILRYTSGIVQVLRRAASDTDAAT